VAASDLDAAAGRGKAPPVAMRADDLVEESRGDENCGNGDDEENNENP